MAHYARPVRVDVVDPSAFTPPYDHALCAALARAGAHVRLQTSRFDYGPVAVAEGYERIERFYRRAPGVAGSRARFAAKLAQHVPDMLAYRRRGGRGGRRPLPVARRSSRWTCTCCRAGARSC